MLFHSYDFLLFFPIVCLVYFLIPHKIKWIWLLIASYYFYMSWSPKYAILMGTSTVITFISGLLIDRTNNTVSNPEKCRKLKNTWVALSFLSNLAILFFFKYYNFFIDNVNTLIAFSGYTIDPPFTDIILPVGISFYTFQALSYTMDVYHEKVKVSKNIFKYALFVSFFPQLVAGPIERSQDLLPQIDERHKFSYDRMKSGLVLMLFGYFLKLVIAERAGILVDEVYNNYEVFEGIPLILATLTFALQIYCDFNAYSCIAIGAAEVMGFTLTTNFAQPYFSKTIREFWRRWHITLGRWFRDNMYIPMGGNRKGKARKYFNTILVFFTSGLWHGASWNFALWGLLHGGYQVVGEMTEPVRNKVCKKLHIDVKSSIYRFCQAAVTFLLVAFAWIFFRAETLEQSAYIVRNLLRIHPSFLWNGGLVNMGFSWHGWLIFAAAASALAVCDLFSSRAGGGYRSTLLKKPLGVQWLLYFSAIFAILIFGRYGPGFQTADFIYFQF